MSEKFAGDASLSKNAAAVDPEKEALINKLAKEMVGSKELIGPVAAPSSLIGKYGLATLKGIENVPAGLVHAVQDNVEHPLKALETVASAAAMGVVLKTVLPETGAAGKIAGVALGAYFTYKSAEPVINTYKFVGHAKTMDDINLAGRHLGDIGGSFVVNSAIAAAGYKLGAAGAERVLLSERLDGFANAKQNFWDGLEKKAGQFTDAVGITTPAESLKTANSLNFTPRNGTERFFASERGGVPDGAVKAAEPVDPNAPMDITIQLKSKGTDLSMDRTLKRIALGRQNPLSDTQFLEKFGATEESLSEVKKFATDHGLNVAEADLRSGRVVLHGRTANFSDAFQTKLENFDVNGLSFRGREGSLFVPNSLTNHIEGVYGMDTRPQANFYAKVLGPAPEAAGKGKVNGLTQARGPEAPPPGDTGNPPPVEPKKASGYMPNEVADGYEFPKGTSGKGQGVAVIEMGGGIDLANEAAYYKAHGLKMPEIKVISVNGAKTNAGREPGADGEVALDSQVIGAAAPDAKQAVIFAPNSDRGFIDAVTRATFPEKGENPNQAISISWGAPMESWTDQGKRGMNLAFKKAALKGLSVFAASGDDGARDASPSRTFQVDYPAADPYVTGTGGTRLTLQNGKVLGEVAWNNGEGRGAGGGGVSPDAVPDYQTGLKIPENANKTGVPGRGVPDIAGNADPATGYRIRVGGSEQIIGGTSAVAPLYSALAVRLNEGLGGTRQVGFMNPFLYKNGMAGTAPFFNDITSGTNNGYNTNPGWDAVTGWGSVNGEKLLAAYKGEGKTFAARIANLVPPELKTGTDIRFLPMNVTMPDDSKKKGA